MQAERFQAECHVRNFIGNLKNRVEPIGALFPQGSILIAIFDAGFDVV
jgi:hypothetical protein